ncbi:putative RNA-binding protein YqeI [Bienertia sinuspersici]
MATTAKVTQFLFHRHIFRLTNTTAFSHFPPQKLSFSLLKPQTHKFSSSFPLFCSLEPNIKLNSDDFKENEDTPETEITEINENEDTPETKIPKIKERELPKLTIKEKKDLCSYANSLGDKLKSQQVGKSGVTDNVAFALDETLEANELLKLKIHRTCPGELEDVVRQLELATGSVVVGQIGRTVIFYRPSVTKLEAEKKKEQARKIFAKRREKAQAAFMMQKREQNPRRPGRPGKGYYGKRRSQKVAS